MCGDCTRSDLVVGGLHASVVDLVPGAFMGEVDEQLDGGVDDADLGGEGQLLCQREGGAGGDDQRQEAPGQGLDDAAAGGLERAGAALQTRPTPRASSLNTGVPA